MSNYIDYNRENTIMKDQFKVQKLISSLEKAKWCIVRYGFGNSFGCNGDSKVVDIYDVPQQKAPEDAFEKCLAVVKMTYANRNMSESDIVGHAYAMVDAIEDQLTMDFAQRYCAEINEKYSGRFIDENYWDNARTSKDIVKKGD